MISPKRKMARSAGASPAAASPSRKKKSMVARTKSSHPPAAEMAYDAIDALKERGGSSLQAIKKYVSANYKVDVEKQSHFIKKYLRAAVASGVLVQIKGRGAAGSFKLGGAAALKAGPGRPTGSLNKAKTLKSGTAKKAAAAPTPKKRAKAKSSPKAKKTTQVRTKKPRIK